MTFKSIVLKNFKYNLRHHLALILCCIFNTSIIYLYGLLLFNNNSGSETIQVIIISFFIVLIVFSFLFIVYVYISYLKSRCKEFALYLALGMSKKNLYKLMNIENIFFVLISTLIGLIAGTIISYLLNIVTNSIPSLNALSFNPNLTGLLFTLIILLFIYGVSFTYSHIYLKKHKIIELFKDSKKENVNKKSNSIYFFTGILMMISPYFFISFTKDDLGQILALPVILTFLAGLYIVISQFGDFIIKFMKAKSQRYYKKLLYLMNLSYKYKEYKKVLYLIAISNGAAIFLIALLIGAYGSEMRKTDIRYPYDLVLFESVENEVLENDLKPILSKFTEQITDKRQFKYISTEKYNNTVISDETVKNILNYNLDVKSGHTIVYGTLSKIPEKNSLKEISITDNKKYQYIVQDSIYGVLCNEMPISYIIDDKDYMNLKGNEHNVHIMKFNSPSEALSAYSEFKEHIKNNSLNVQLSSKYEYVESQKQLYGSIIFLLGLIALMFFICSGAIVYFKVFINLDKDKDRFFKLNLIGIKKRQIKEALTKELSIIFSIPLILGGMGAYLWVVTLFFKDYFFHVIALYSGIIVCVYILIQLTFHKITQKNYVRRILELCKY